MSKVKVELHADGATRYSAMATVKRPGAPTDDQYGGYGSTPLEAALDLARTLANVVGYERSEFQRIDGTVFGEELAQLDPESYSGEKDRAVRTQSNEVNK
jgi:hypothetical protein